MKNLIYIASLALMLLTISCSKSDFDNESILDGNKDAVQITARIAPYISTNVSTRANKTDAEKNINNTCLAVFRDDKCIDVRYSATSNATFVIAKDQLEDGDRFYIIANIDGDPTDRIKDNSTIDELLGITTSVSNNVLFEPTSANIDTWALPMFGVYEITDVDNLPGIVPVPLESLYAKMNFTIWSKPEQEAVGHDKASFHLESIELHNVPKTVDFVGGTANSTNDVVEVYEEVFDGSYSLDQNKCFAQGNSKTASFVCYVPERFLKPTTAAENYTYPFGNIADLDDNERERYPQRYKPLLVEGRKATFVRFKGEYINHQGHNYIVSYDIYFGEDNYGNFDIERNKQYNHNVTIKGILVNQDESENQNGISIDHRVDVTRVAPIITNLRRETLLDSHFEVRPLRIRKNPDYTGSTNGATVKVEVSYKDQADSKWVGIESSFGGKVTQDAGTYLVDSELPANKKNAAGKRRYFTDGLPQSLQDPVDNIPVTEDGEETVWIYIDEANPANAGDKVRIATITVTYIVNGTPYGDPIIYDLNQRELFKVTKGENNYLIEYEEEYLHNFDADDSFGVTDYEGMKWGLDGEQLSYEHQAILVHNSGMESLTKNIRSAVMAHSPFYDFYLTRDFNKSTYYFENEEQYTGIVHNHNGWTFCKEIIDEVNSTEHSSDLSDDIKVLTLAQDPKSAVEYCYNKNKRNAKGEVAEMVWYLPAIDEIEEIVMSQYDGNYSYIRFEDFRDKFYWSSQPAFYRNIFLVDRASFGAPGDRMGHFMTDNKNYARATKVHFNGGDPNDSNNYTIENSGTATNAYYNYLYMFTGDSFFALNTDVKEQHIHTVESLLKRGSCDVSTKCGSSQNNGEYWQFKWDNNDVDETTEKLYPWSIERVEPGYKHRKDDLARVRCVRKQQ